MTKTIRTGASLAAILFAGLLAFGTPASAAPYDHRGGGSGGPSYGQGDSRDHNSGGDHNYGGGRGDRGDRADRGDRGDHGDRGHDFRGDRGDHGRRDFGHDRGHNGRWQAHYRRGARDHRDFRGW